MPCDCSVGVEITPHKRDHAYRVVDDLSFPLFHPSWGVRTHLALPGSYLELRCSIHIEPKLRAAIR